MNWRYATKVFDKSKKIEESTLDELTEILRLSPSSYGLQPWKFIIVKNEDVREKIKEAGYGQGQITDASHLIVFANKTNIDEKLVDEYINFMASERGIDVSNLDGFKGMINGVFSSQNVSGLRNWASRQVYLAAGVLIASCAVLNVDACPMEGINMKAVDDLLNLENLGLESRMVVALGYRDESDEYILKKKIRFPKEDVFIEIN